MTIWSVRSMSSWSSPLPLTAALPTLLKEPTSDQAPPGRAAGTCRLALRVRARLGQASAPDQLVLPQPRRGDLRRVPAADGGHGLEELPQDLARRDRGGQDQVPLPGLGPEPPRRWPGSSSASAAGAPPSKPPGPRAPPPRRQSVETLGRGGAAIAPPGPGPPASRGGGGPGGLGEPPEIRAAAEAALGGALFAPRSLDGLRRLVTAGGTREPIDAVRYFGN